MQQPSNCPASHAPGYHPPHDTRDDNGLIPSALTKRAIQRLKSGGHLPGEAPAQQGGAANE